MIELDISWAGRDAADFSRVFKVAAEIDNFAPALKKVATDVIAPSIKANFDAGGRPPWAPLSPVTIEKKAALGYRYPSKILVATGAMQEAATDPDNYRITSDELRAAPYGIEYWGFHQVGTPMMPQRIIMMLQATDRTAINRIMADYFRSFMVFDPRKPGGRQFTGGGL